MQHIPLVPENERKQSHTITLERKLWDLAVQIGRGNGSAGIRYALIRLTQPEESNNKTPTV